MVTLLFFLTESSFLTLHQTGAQKGELSEDRVGRPCGKEATSANSCRQSEHQSRGWQQTLQPSAPAGFPALLYSVLGS